MNSLDVLKIGLLNVHLVPDDITNIKSDVVVSSDDIQLSMSGGVSKRILAIAGEDMRLDALEKTPGIVGEVIVSNAGSLGCCKIFHALVLDYATEEFPDYELIMSLTITCLDLANEMGYSSISIPPMGAGAGLLDATVSSEAIVDAITRWAPDTKVNLKEVYIATLNVEQSTLKSFLMSLMDRRVRASYEKHILDLQARLEEVEGQLSEASDNHEKRVLASMIPHPISFIRSRVEIGVLASDRAWDLCNCFEAIVRYVVSCMLAVARDHKLSDKTVEYFDKPLTFGKWVELMRKYSKLLHANHNKDLIDSIADYYCDQKGKPTEVGKFIDSSISIRNKMAHPPGGMRPDEAMCEGFETELRTGIDIAIKDLLKHVPWTLCVVKSIGSFSSDGNVEYLVSLLNGDRSIFDNKKIYCPNKLNPGTVGLWFQDSNRFLDLYPFVTYRRCPTCQLENVFFLDEIRNNSKGRWWNYTDGHVIQEDIAQL